MECQFGPSGPMTYDKDSRTKGIETFQGQSIRAEVQTCRLFDGTLDYCTGYAGGGS